LHLVAGIAFDLIDDGDDDERTQRVGRGQFVDGGIFRRPMGRRIELRAELIRGEIVMRSPQTIGL
jgi:hypothetical protein